MARRRQKTVPSVLIVNDALFAAEHIKHLLQEMGVRVRAVTSAEAAYEELRRQEFDLILMDVYLSDSEEFYDGLEATRHIRKSMNIGTRVVFWSSCGRGAYMLAQAEGLDNVGYNDRTLFFDPSPVLKFLREEIRKSTDPRDVKRKVNKRKRGTRPDVT